MARDAIDDLRHRADRTAFRLFVLAGTSSGLIVGVALLFLQNGQYRAAAAVAVLALVVGTFMIIAAQHIRFSALALYEVGADLRAEAITLRRRQDEFRERFAEVRTRDQGIERALVDLRARLREVEMAQSPAADPGPAVTADPDLASDLAVDLTVPDVRVPVGGPVTSDLPVTRALPVDR